MNKLFLLLIILFLAGCSLISRKPFHNTTSKTAQPIINYDANLDGQLDSLARQITLQLHAFDSRTVGLTGFSDLKGRSRRFEKYLEIEFLNRLVHTGRFKVCSPEDLMQLGKKPLTSLLGDAASIDSRTRDILRSLSIDALIVGSTIVLPQSIKVSAKVISTRTGAIISAASVMIHKDSFVVSLLDEFGYQNANTAYGSRSNLRIGNVIRANENQYIKLIPSEYTLYVKQINNYEYELFTENISSVELFLNEEYRVMKRDEMLSLICDSERYILSLRDIDGRMATFTFAQLSANRSRSTETFSAVDSEAYDELNGGNAQDSDDEGGGSDDDVDSDASQEEASQDEVETTSAVSEAEQFSPDLKSKSTEMVKDMISLPLSVTPLAPAVTLLD